MAGNNVGNVGSFEVSWLVNETGTVHIMVSGAPRYRTNLKKIEPGPRLIRDAIVNAVEHALTERFGLNPDEQEV